MYAPAIPLVLSLLALCLLVGRASSFGIRDPVSSLLTKHAEDIAKLKSQTTDIMGNMDGLPFSNDVFFLRYCLAGWSPEQVAHSLEWRKGKGKAICQAAAAAYAKATEGEKWNNEPVLDMAPHSDRIKKFITPEACLTTPSNQGDLIYIVRAGKIDDVGLLEAVSKEELADFFLYGKEVNNLVANDRSFESDVLKYLIVVNELKGVKLVGGESGFRDALSLSSKTGNTIYPSLSGPSVLLNLPALLSALVNLFKPIFPKEVAERIKFERGPLNDVEDLKDIQYGGKERAKFLMEIDEICK